MSPTRSSMMLSMVIMLMLTACVPDKERGTEDLGPGVNKHKFDAYGINFTDDNRGTDKGIIAMYRRGQVEQRQPQLLYTLERRIERIPGVADARFLSYKDTLIVSVLPNGTPKRDVVNLVTNVPHTPVAPQNQIKNSPDGLHHLIVERIRARLQAETNYNILYVTTNPALYHRTADLHERLMRGEQVLDTDVKALVNDLGYTVKGYNLVD